MVSTTPQTDADCRSEASADGQRVAAVPKLQAVFSCPPGAQGFLPHIANVRACCLCGWSYYGAQSSVPPQDRALPQSQAQIRVPEHAARGNARLHVCVIIFIITVQAYGPTC